MSTKAAHTDLPWSYIEAPADQITPFRHYEIGGMNSIHWVARTRYGSNKQDIALCEADLNLIITAVNSHQELLTRLYNLRNAAYVAISADKITQELEHFYAEADETLKKFIK